MSDDEKTNGWRGRVDEKLKHISEGVRDIKDAVDKQADHCTATTTNYFGRLTTVEVMQAQAKDRDAATRRMLLGVAVVVVAAALLNLVLGK